MTKVLVGNVGSYTFDASAKTVTLTGFPTLTIEQILLITNVTSTKNEIIYQFDQTAKAGTISGNVITLVFDTTTMADTDDLQIWVELDNASSAPVLTQIQGPSGDIAEVTTGKELKVVNPPPVAPSGATPVRIVQKSNGTSDDFFTTITNGLTMVLQRVSGGSETNTAGSIVELYYAPNGNTTGLEIIEDIYVNGNSGQKDLNQSYLGDGTAAILLRRRVFGGAAVEITGRWEGYEE
jgi:hypothetical protein